MKEGFLKRNIFHRVWIKKAGFLPWVFYNANAVIFKIFGLLLFSFLFLPTLIVQEPYFYWP
jgi:hypothetical protein